MSQRKERIEKNCLNCNAEIHGRYCHICGQENIEPKETFWHLVTHFVYDITHFDGKFFSSVKYLLLRPGFLPYEYMVGRRMSYLNPLRLYIFTSAFFFVFFFTMVPTKEIIKINSGKSYATLNKDLKSIKDSLLVTLNDSIIPKKKKEKIVRQLSNINADLAQITADTTNLSNLRHLQSLTMDLGEGNYTTIRAYDSIQNLLPANRKDSWLKQKFIKRSIEVKGEYGNEGNTLLNKLFNKFVHTFPQILFVSLPIIALVLQLLYFKKRKYFYVDHVIFTVYLYCAMFIMIFLRVCFSKMETVKYLSWTSFLAVPVILYMVWYIYKSMRNFYGQSRVITIFKFLLLMFLSLLVMTILFVLFFTFSVFTF